MAFELKDLDVIPAEAIPAAILRLSARLVAHPASAPSPAPAATESLLTAAEMAKRLNVHESAVRTMEREGKIPGLRVGRYVRFRAEEVEAALADAKLK
jgi:excisionase family DNA binding protein